MFMHLSNDNQMLETTINLCLTLGRNYVWLIPCILILHWSINLEIILGGFMSLRVTHNIICIVYLKRTICLTRPAIIINIITDYYWLHCSVGHILLSYRALGILLMQKNVRYIELMVDAVHLLFRSDKSINDEPIVYKI